MPSEAPVARKIPWGKLAVVAVILGVVAILLLRGSNMPELIARGRSWLDWGMALIRSGGPWLFFTAMAVLPAVGAPMMAFTIPAGEAFAAQMTLPGVIVATIVAIAANLALTYWLAHWALRPLIEGLVTRYGYKVPRVNERNALSVALVFRLTPGLPFNVGGYILVLAGVPFRLFMLVSWLCVLPWAVGAVVMGQGIMNGNFKTAGAGFGVLILAVVAVQFVRKKFAKRES